MDVNINGVLYTAQAAGRQMERLGLPGSIIMIGSMSGSITNQVCFYVLLLHSTSNFLWVGNALDGLQYQQSCRNSNGTLYGL